MGSSRILKRGMHIVRCIITFKTTDFSRQRKTRSFSDVVGLHYSI